MSTAMLDPKLTDFGTQLRAALSGEGAVPYTGGYPMGDGAAASRDATILAGSLLSAYQTAVMANPDKAFRPTAAMAGIQLASAEEVTSEKFWSELWNVIQIAGPAVVNAMSKEYRPETPSLQSVIQTIPPHRRNDKSWVDFTTRLLLNLAQGTVQALSGQKDLTNPANQPPMPQPPPGVDKSWLSDAFDTVVKVGKVVLPIAIAAVA